MRIETMRKSTVLSLSVNGGFLNVLLRGLVFVCFIGVSIISTESAGSEMGKLRSVEESRYYFSGNNGIPRRIVVGFDDSHMDFLEDFYLEILSMLEKTKNIWAEESSGFHFTVIYSNLEFSDFVRFQNQLREKLGLSPNSDLPNFSSWMGDATSYGWTQDEGEFLFPLSNPAPDSAVFLRTGVDHFFPTIADNSVQFSKVPVLDLVRGDMDHEKNRERKTSSRQGGNIEVTHEGAVFVGNSMFVESVEHLRELSVHPVIELDTAWTFIGHVDEQFAFVPAENGCGTVLVAASPLTALLELARNHELSEEDFSDIAWDLNIIYKKSEIADSLRHFLRKGEGLESVDSLASFDLRKKSRTPDVQRNVSTRMGFLEKVDGVCPYYISSSNVDTFVRMNLEAERKIENNLKILRKNSKCLDNVARVPQLFYLRPRGYCSREPYQRPLVPSKRVPIESKNSTANLTVLFDHVFMPDSGISALTKLAHESLGYALGGSGKVHLIDTHELTHTNGSVHCQSLVFRDYRSIF